MIQKLILSQLQDIETKFKDAIEGVQIDDELVETYKKTRGIHEELEFPTWTIEDIAYSYLDSMDLLKFLRDNSSGEKFGRIIKVLSPLKDIENEIRNYNSASYNFRRLIYKELIQTIEPIEGFLIKVINWVANQVAGDSNIKEDDDDLDDIMEQGES